MNKKVIWLVNQYATPTAVRTRQIVLGQRMEEHGYQVYIICGSKVHGKDENIINDEKKIVQQEYDGAHFIIIKIDNYTSNFKRVKASLQFQNRIWSLRDQLPTPDVIVSNFAGLFGNKFLKWKHKYGTKIIYDVLDLWPEAFIDVGFLKKNSIPARILYNMEHKSYREANGIIFSFEGGKDYIIEKRWDIASGGDIDINKVGYLNNGVDLESVDRNKTEFVLDDVDLDTDKFKVVYLGAIRRANNTDLIVETARILRERGAEDITVLLYGDGDYRQHLEDKVEELNLNNIKFKGRLPVEYAPNMLSRCDLSLFNFMNTPISRFGLSPNKLFMYFASGKPVLSTVRPNYEIVGNRECGIVTKNNPEAVADGIIRFSKMDKYEYNRYCTNCRVVAHEFDYKNLVKVLIRQIEG